MSENKENLPDFNANETVTNQEPVIGGIFGITSETKESNNVPIPVPKKLTAPHAYFPQGWQFPIAKLVNVVVNPTLEKKDKTTTEVLQFVFRDNQGRQFIHTEWKLELDDPKLKVKIEGMNSRIKHIHVACFGPWAEGKELGSKANSFLEYFNIVEQEFNNKKTEKGEKIYASQQYYIKLTYYNANLGFPLSPNFIEKVNDKDPICKVLQVNLAYDALEPKKTSMPDIPGMGGAIEGNLPSFDNGYV
jgi:hypothetical protein